MSSASSSKPPAGSAGSGRVSSCRPVKAVAAAPLGGMPVDKVQPDSQGRLLGNRLSPVCMEIPVTRCVGSHWSVSAFQHMGDRRTQEDRFTIVPNLEPDGRFPCPCSFFGVFDGTVGDFASDNVKDLVIPKLRESPSWQAMRNVSASRHSDQEKLLEQALRDMYENADANLLSRCAMTGQHYATCTSVTLLVVGDLLCVGHLGDSRIIIGVDQVDPGSNIATLVGEQLTHDHKPDQDAERMRIEKCGGMVERLQNHSNKPFIRGGDFMMRKALGEQPMQLQYSRAFGAKDLKIFGLSSIPDVRLIRMGSPAYRHVRFVILASDGLWDVISTQQAVLIAHQASAEGHNPAEMLVRAALLEQSRRKARADNVTAVCVQFDPM
eukprot:CAMPEP_0115182100 /NCGR_PEP_ID=MMETSP0270-20121206/7772_1 /TAXON_ID=71861 /ORGANISM="Scrippsiella trochoidea, Strain CCMP3099" /LENGTH=379 /DNA_ID=CAMNT_0002595143 /DNA_START=107 /DNA_END=1246 /DNA_ORIENTATION=+